MADDLDDQLEYNVSDSPEGATVPLESLEEEEKPSKKDYHRESKRSKKDPKLKEKKKFRMQEEAKKKEELGTKSPAFIADYVIAKLRRDYPDLSGIELQDRSIPESMLVDTTSFDAPRNLENFPSFFSFFGLDKPLGAGELVVILSHSALRACHVRSSLQKGLKLEVIKLIQKNNPKYDSKVLKSKLFIAASTPGRIRKLVTLGELDLKRITRVVLDSAFLDIKKNNVWDLAETIPLLSETSQHGAAGYVF